MKLIAVALLVNIISIISFAEHPARFIWPDHQTNERHIFAYFRYDINLVENPSEGTIHIFADSRYHLFVNGTFVQSGPGRTFPENPEYDTWDIKPLLRTGNNYIVVKVLWNGVETFQLLKNKPGFIAWGSIKAGEKSLELATPGQWVALKETGYDQLAPRFSFAQGVIDVYDARQGIQNWNDPDKTLENWQDPVAVEWQDLWGNLKPRFIEPLNQFPMIPKEITGMYSLTDDDDFYSFRIKIPDSNYDEYQKLNLRSFAYTFIYSPRRQRVDAGLWWGEFYLNGRGPLPHQGEIPDQLGRRRVRLNLQRGWNHFFISYNIIWGNWEYYMALPKSAGLVLSPYRDFESDVKFLTAGAFTPFENEEIIKELSLPLILLEDLPEDLSAGWIERTRHESANNPAKEITWRTLGESLPYDPWDVTDIRVKPGPGTAIMFDHGENGYGRIFIEYEAPEGTIIDIGWEEDALNGIPSINKRYGVFTVAQHTATEGYNYFETYKPYGHRYLQVNVRNNTSEVVIKRVGKIEQLYPLEKIGSFRCSDPMMNAIWEMGWRTIRICAEDIYLDPFRERGLYAGDVLAQTTLSYVTSGDMTLARKTLQEVRHMYRDVLADFPNVLRDRHGIGLLGDYPIISLVNLGWYFDITRDTTFIRESYPAYQAMMDSLALSRNEKGIYWHAGAFIEWIRIDKQGSLATVHALIARAYEVMAQLAEVTGNREDRDRYRLLAEETARITRVLFWDEQKGAYFDGFTRDGDRIDSWFPASSAWPSIWGITTPGQEKQLRDFFARELEDIGSTNRQAKTTPYGGQYIIGALYKHGNADIAERFMKKYWSHMILEGDDTLWENFYYDPHESKSHGWSGAPTYYMSTQVLGVQLGFPEPTNLDIITISPQAETIDWAQGTVPHPRGLVKVDWRVVGDVLFLDYEAPEGVPVVVKPRGRLAEFKLVVNGVIK
jgi:alpha-L-rhamnosidase